MLLIIMGPLCNISIWGVMGFIFRDMKQRVESILASANLGCTLLFGLL